MRIIGWLVVLAACSKSGDYKAARATYCKSVDADIRR